MTASPRILATTVPERRVPPLGGFSPTFLGLEIRRLLRNRRPMVFTLIMPPAFFLLFGGLSQNYQHQSVGHGNVSAYLMISFAAPGGSVGPHFDNYDVFLLQAEGQRRWKIGQMCEADSKLLAHADLR